MTDTTETPRKSWNPFGSVFTILGILMGTASLISLIQRWLGATTSLEITQDALSFYEQMVAAIASALFLEDLWRIAGSSGVPLPDLVSPEVYLMGALPSALVAHGYTRGISDLRSQGVLPPHRWSYLLDGIVVFFVGLSWLGWALLASLIKDSVRDETHTRILAKTLQWLGSSSILVAGFLLWNAIQITPQ